MFTMFVTSVRMEWLEAWKLSSTSLILLIRRGMHECVELYHQCINIRYGSNVDRTPCMSPAQSQSNISYPGQDTNRGENKLYYQTIGVLIKNAVLRLSCCVSHCLTLLFKVQNVFQDIWKRDVSHTSIWLKRHRDIFYTKVRHFVRQWDSTFKIRHKTVFIQTLTLLTESSSDVDTASIVSSQFSEVSTASVPASLHQSKVTRRGQEVRRSGSRHHFNIRPKSLSMSIHTVQFEKG